MTYADLVGALFMLLSFLILLGHPSVRNDRQVAQASCFVLGLHHCAAICNAFFFELRSTLYDAVRFHRLAADPHELANTEYALALKKLYTVFGVSHFLGEEASVLAVALSIIVFLEIAALLEIKSPAPLVLIMGLLPSGIIHRSVTMREPFQALFFMSALWCILLIRRRPSVAPLAGLLFSCLAITYLHQALIACALLLFFGGLAWAVRTRQDLNAGLLLAAVTFAPFLLPKVIRFAVSRSATIKSLAEGDIREYTESYRSSLELVSNSDYGFQMDTGSLGGIVSTVPPILLLFHLAPLPWQVRRFVDLYAFAEVLLRLCLFWGTYQALKSNRGEKQQYLWFLTLTSLGMDCIWALGTTNWGTASRHHLVTYPIWVLVGGGSLLNFRFDKDFRDLEERRQARLRRQLRTKPV